MHLPSLGPKTRFYLLPFLGGCLFSLGFPTTWMPHFFFMPMLGFLLFFQAVFTPDGQGPSVWKKDILAWLCFSFGTCLFGHYWIPHTLKEFGGLFFPFNFVLGSLFTLIVFPQHLVFICCYRLLSRRMMPLNVATRNLFWALLLTVLEHYVPQQFPAHVGHAWLQLAPRLGLAPIFGAPVFSLASFWAVLVLVERLNTRQWDWPGIAFFTTFLAANLSYSLPPADREGHPLKIRMVQANVENLLKIASEEGNPAIFQEIVDRYFKLSTQSQEQVDLILWPETAYPELLQSSLMQMSPELVPRVFRQTISQTKAQLITGGYDHANRTNPHLYETEYNATFHFGKMAFLKNVYHKRILMPFGEGLPFGLLNPLLAKVITNLSFFAKGQSFPLFKLESDITLINVICYEILFSSYIRNYLNHTLKAYKQKASFIINMTNDSWYGRSAEPYQHQFLSHWRALEFQIPIVRVTNTGLSSILYPDGSQSKDMGLFQEGSRDYQLFLKDGKVTPFQKYGFTLTLILGVALLIAFFLIPMVRKTFFEQVVKSNKALKNSFIDHGK